MPDGDGDGSELLREDREVSMPERIAIPSVPIIKIVQHGFPVPQFVEAYHTRAQSGSFLR